MRESLKLPFSRGRAYLTTAAVGFREELREVAKWTPETAHASKHRVYIANKVVDEPSIPPF